MLQTTPLWLVFTLQEADILVCRVVTTNKETAMDSLIDIAEANNNETVWYKLVRFEAVGIFYPGIYAHVVVELGDNGNLKVLSICDQYEMIDQQYRNNQDLWVDEIEII